MHTMHTQMYDHQHVNKYMIEFSKHVTHTGWNDVALYGEFYWDFMSASRTRSCHWITPKCSSNSRPMPLKCDTHYWECREGHTLWSEQAVHLHLCTAKSCNHPTTLYDAPMMSCTNPGIGADGKLTQEEQERHCLKGLCYYCSLTINLPALTVGNTQHPKSPVAGHTTFTGTGEPEVTIEEVVGGC